MNAIKNIKGKVLIACEHVDRSTFCVKHTSSVTSDFNFDIQQTRVVTLYFLLHRFYAFIFAGKKLKKDFLFHCGILIDIFVSTVMSLLLHRVKYKSTSFDFTWKS